MCILFNLAHPDWLLAKLTEELSPWFYATEYKNIPIQIQRVYNPLCGKAWRTRFLAPDSTWDDDGSVHKDLRVALELAQQYIDEVNFCELKQKIENFIEIKSEKNKHKN